LAANCLLQQFGKPACVASGGFWKTFHDGTSSLVYPFQPKGFELKNTSGFQKNWHIK
jgi:hypothetical protein